jgi:hypothetical protein
MSLIADLIAEIEAARARTVEPWEGFKDLNRALVTSDGAEAQQFVQIALDEYSQRDTLSSVALTALKDLARDGYPTDIAFVTEGAILDVISAQQRTVTAAVGTITAPGEAAAADVVVGEPVPR